MHINIKKLISVGMINLHPPIHDGHLVLLARVSVIHTPLHRGEAGGNTLQRRVQAVRLGVHELPESVLDAHGGTVNPDSLAATLIHMDAWHGGKFALVVDT